ncbi:MAG: tetratricopeptide repeat protein [Patescibacteria group bacterium]
METKNEFISYLENLSLLVLGILFFALPILISTLTTDQYAIPKQAVLGATALLALVFLSLKMIFEGSVRIRRTPYDLAIILFTIALFLSSVFAVNKADSITSYVLVLFSIIVYFVTVNLAKDKKQAFFLTASLVLGGIITSILSIFSLFKVYVIPYPFTHNPTFTPLGSLLDQAIYLALLLPVALYLVLQYKPTSSLKTAKLISFGAGVLIILIGFIVTIYQLFYIQKPTILPFETGLQTAFATISQDTGRILKGFLLGSGFGTYAVDFLRFKPPSFNQNIIWSLTFFRSSSFILEILATTGILGLVTFIFLAIKVIREIKGNDKNFMLLSVILIFLASLFVPFSLTMQTLLFVLLALFAVYEGFNSQKKGRFFDVEIQLVALRNGLLALEAPKTNRKNSFMQHQLLPIMLSIIVFIFVLFVGNYGLNYVISDIGFQRSVVAASKNNGSLTYEEQTKAIAKFPYRDGFYRVYSQTNLALANSLVSQVPKGQAPDKRTQDNIIALIQQSINSGRNATAIAPQTALNWQNLSTIYRALIGFGQNAENFAIVSQQQAMLLDPNNPQQYLALGGIYYQLGQWDNAQNQFQIAINLKPDLPISYYNLGHAMQEKNDVKGALAQYEIVKNLVANNNPEAYKQITGEIEVLTLAKKQEEQQQKVEPISQIKPVDKSLTIDKSSPKLPPVNPKVKIPPPTNATQSARK